MGHFLLREVELASLTLHDDVVKFDVNARTVTLSLAVSKADPAGRGAKRTLACCGCADGLQCIYDVVEELVARQTARTGVCQR